MIFDGVSDRRLPDDLGGVEPAQPLGRREDKRMGAVQPRLRPFAGSDERHHVAGRNLRRIRRGVRRRHGIDQVDDSAVGKRESNSVSSFRSKARKFHIHLVWDRAPMWPPEFKNSNAVDLNNG